MRIPVPDFIEKQLELFRLGFALPQLYIEWHRCLALRAVEELKKEYKIHAEAMVDDGWFDGMKFLQVIAEDRRGNLLKLKWSDSQCWYLHLPSGGWVLFDLVKNKKTPEPGSMEEFAASMSF